MKYKILIFVWVFLVVGNATAKPPVPRYPDYGMIYVGTCPSQDNNPVELIITWTPGDATPEPGKVCPAGTYAGIGGTADKLDRVNQQLLDGGRAFAVNPPGEKHWCSLGLTHTISPRTPGRGSAAAGCINPNLGKGRPGDAGPQGPQGPRGEMGPAGPPGKSALKDFGVEPFGDIGLRWATNESDKYTIGSFGLGIRFRYKIALATMGLQYLRGSAADEARHVGVSIYGRLGVRPLDWLDVALAIRWSRSGWSVDTEQLLQELEGGLVVTFRPLSFLSRRGMALGIEAEYDYGHGFSPDGWEGNVSHLSIRFVFDPIFLF